MTVGADEHKECYSITDFETESNSSHAFDANTRCGWNKCKPDGLQKLNTPKWFLFFLVCYSAAQGMFVETYLQRSICWNIKLRVTFRSQAISFISFI